MRQLRSGKLETSDPLDDKTYLDWVVSALFAPSVYFKRAREVAESHPLVVSTACGITAGIFLGFILVDGEKASEASLYGHIFKKGNDDVCN